MDKILWVAKREFLSTVATKGFLLGILLTPLIMLVCGLGIKYMIDNQEAPRVEGEFAVIDRTGQVFDGVAEYLKPETIAARRDSNLELVKSGAGGAALKFAEAVSGEDIEEGIEKYTEFALGKVPAISTVELSPGVDLEAEKDLLREGSGPDKRLAIAVIEEDAITPPEGSEEFGKYSFYGREGVDDRVNDELRDALREAIVDARVLARGWDRDEIKRATRVRGAEIKTVTAEGEEDSDELFKVFLPMVFLLLLFVSTLTSGQYILTTTVEEKSNRVVEVLLSAVSPMQLMTGKIVGQMAVGLSILVLYSSMGIGTLIFFSALGKLKLSLLLYLCIFFVIAYFILGSVMAAIGAAVNEMREAQTLMAPVMLVTMTPWLLWMPISQDPNGTLATVLSFIPPISTFAMLLRLTSTAPPPLWQVWLSIGLGFVGVYAALWFAAKVFRVGLLMYGKPPTFGTLIRWVRMA